MATKKELRNKLCRLLEAEGASFGCDALAGEIIDLIERGNVLRLDPEAPQERALPGRLRLSPRILENPLLGQPKGWYIRSTEGGPAILAVFRHGAWPLEEDRAERLITDMLTAYNEREEIDAEVEAGVALERERYVAVLVHLLDQFDRVMAPHFCAMTEAAVMDARTLKNFIREARRKIESGEPAVQPGDCPGPDFPGLKRFTRDPFAEWNCECGAKAIQDASCPRCSRTRNSCCGARTLPGESHRCPSPEPSPEWPERLMAPFVGIHQWEEAARRWEEEPRLQARIGKAVGKLVKHFDLAPERQVGITGDLFRILTGKES